MTGCTIEEMVERPGDDVVEVMATAYVPNALHVAAFAGDEKARLEGNRGLFRLATSGMLTGTWLRARDQGTTAGALHFARSPRCIPPPEALPQFAAILTASLGPRGSKVAEWFRTWAEVHPAGDHWHFGPFAVAPGLQGRGIGSQLLGEFCRRIDAVRGVGYLETDEPRNVVLYQRFGFRVVRQSPVIGVTNWFMERPVS